MQNFLNILTSESKNAELPEEYNFLGKLIGSWEIDYIDNSNLRSMKGEWHFSWVLDGMAIQDVILLPGMDTKELLNQINAALVPQNIGNRICEDRLCFKT